MTHDPHSDVDVSARLRSALRERPAPAPTWDLAAIKARGRRRRRRAQLLPVALGLAVVAGAAAPTVVGSSPWPWEATRTTVAAPARVATPEQVVRDYMDARIAGDNAGAFHDYWAEEPDTGVEMTIQWTAQKLLAKDVTIGQAQPDPTALTAHRLWRQVVSVPLSYQWDYGPGLRSGKFPFSGSVVLVRDSDTDPWRIWYSDQSPDFRSK